MSEQRWAVLGTETGNEWLVAHPGDVCHGSDGRLECWAVHSQHDTWTEAMQEADRMARTVTVTLPADPHVWLSGLDSDGRRYVRDVNDNEICYEPGELETLALHLLAYDRKERR